MAYRTQFYNLASQLPINGPKPEDGEGGPAPANSSDAARNIQS
jgi:hypothetical protein